MSEQVRQIREIAKRFSIGIPQFSNKKVSEMILEFADYVESIDKKRKELEQFYLEAIKLLDAAICPCCDKSGTYYDNNGEVCQCQWCDEVSRLPQPLREKDNV